jgi:glycosyltransferase involved in cell wall biosynthesis
MIDIQIDEQQSLSSLFTMWEKQYHFPLTLQLLFRNCFGKDIRVLSPDGTYPSNERLEALRLLHAKYPKWNEIVECELILCSRKRPNETLGCLAILKGVVNSIVSCLGWSISSPVFKSRISVEEQLKERSNDYWAFEIAAKALGLGDLVKGEAPELSEYPSITFVIPSRDIHDTIEPVVRSIYIAVNSMSNVFDWECLVVDDANNAPLSNAAKIDCHVRHIRTEKRVYCGGARNLGIRAAQHEVIILLDGDTMISPNYIQEHVFRQLLSGNLITVSLREYLNSNRLPILRKPDISQDTRFFARYSPERIGLSKVNQTIEVRAIEDTDNFRQFGFGRKIGPIDLPFMIKGNNFAINKSVGHIKFPPDFIGYGPEDVTFGAKAIARGCIVLPVLSTGVFHINHPPRSGSSKNRDEELMANLNRMKRHLSSPLWEDWVTNDGA